MAKKTSKTATTKGTKGTAPKKAVTKKAIADKKMSILDAAAKVLGESNEPMACKAMIEAMGTKGHWSSPAGKTPHATLYSALLREINTKGAESRFQKMDRGLFALAGAKATKAEPKAKGKKPAKSAKPADGTPGPKAVSELFNV
jgi:hypothetical protein